MVSDARQYEASVPVRIERYGAVDPVTPRFVRFLVEALGAESLDNIQAPTELRADYTCFRGLVVIELKTLEEDASVRMSNLAEKLETRPDWPLLYGSLPVSSILANLTSPEPVKNQI